MKRILGLDLGVSSIGWAYVTKDDDNNGNVLRAGVRIIPLTTDEETNFAKGAAITTNADRRQMRSARRNRQRYKLRRENLRKCLREIGFLNGDDFEIKGVNDREFYGIRAKAAREQVSKEEFAAMLFRMNKNRGYKSNRKVNNEESDSDYLNSIAANDQYLHDQNMTVGERQLDLLKQCKRVKQVVFSRKSYLEEFDTIWETQSKFYPALTDELKEQIRDRIIYYQRPLKSQKHLLANCQFERAKVAPRSSPLFQVFKIHHNLNNVFVRKKRSRHERLLTPEERETLLKLLNEKRDMKKRAILKAIDLNPNQWEINFEKLEGNRTRAELLKLWKKHGIKGKDDFLDLDLSLTGNDFDKQPAMQLWHLLYSAEDPIQLRENLTTKFGFSKEEASSLALMPLDSDYAALSSRAMRKLMPYLADGNDYATALAYCNYEHGAMTTEERDSRALLEQLELIKKNELRNPVVEKILNQVINLINEIIQDPELGRPDEVVIEMARELKSNAKVRQRMQKQINSNEKENKEAAEFLRKEGLVSKPTRKDIIRYKLWKETDGVSLYTGNPIPLSELFTQAVDVDHIIPQARLYDDSFTNKVVVEASANRKKSDRTAYDYIADEFGETGIEQYLARIESVKGLNPAKKRKLKMKVEEIPEDFIERQLRETQFIVRETTKRLQKAIRNVRTTTGSVTAILRERWQLNELMRELNLEKYREQGLTEIKKINGRDMERIKDWSKRDDHRHHAVDALIVAFTEQKHIQTLNNLNQLYEKKKDLEASEVYRESLTRFEEPIPNLRREAKKALEDLLVSVKKRARVATWNNNTHKSSNGEQVQRILTPRKQLHKETVYGKIRWYNKKPVKLNKKFDQVHLIADPAIRAAVQKRLDKHDGDPSKAFANLKKDPVLMNGEAITAVICFEDRYVVRKAIDPALKVKKVVDHGIQRILQNRLDEYGGNAKKAFADLENNPIWLNEEKGIDIKRVRVDDGADELLAVHENENSLDPQDFVYTRNNHHMAFFEDPQGNRTFEIVSFFEAMERKLRGEPVIQTATTDDRVFQFSLMINDYWLFPSDDFDPWETDLNDRSNYPLISNHLFRVQKMSGNAPSRIDVFFRHHLETTLDRETAFSYRRVSSMGKLTGRKVFISRLGTIHPAD